MMKPHDQPIDLSMGFKKNHTQGVVPIPFVKCFVSTTSGSTFVGTDNEPLDLRVEPNETMPSSSTSNLSIGIPSADPTPYVCLLTTTNRQKTILRSAYPSYEATKDYLLNSTQLKGVQINEQNVDYYMYSAYLSTRAHLCRSAGGIQVIADGGEYSDISDDEDVSMNDIPVLQKVLPQGGELLLPIRIKQDFEKITPSVDD